MKPINIYTLTRLNKTSDIRKMERQMSGRNRFLNIKEWEIIGIRKFIDSLLEVDENASAYKFFYSFQLPKLGKEFDLLIISDETVINIEIKSDNVSDYAIKKQLIQNRHYLTTLGRTIYSYTFISEQNRLVRLTNTEKLTDSDWNKLCFDLSKGNYFYEGDIEELFKEDKFLISPLTDPERFLQQEYFLTSQQRDIKNKILRKIDETTCCFQGFTGLPGTGKTILLYDIALKLSKNSRVCVLHFGSGPREVSLINKRLKRVDFYCCNKAETLGLEELTEELQNYSAILIDEGHRITEKYLNLIYNTAVSLNIPVIFSFDLEEEIALSEIHNTGNLIIEALPGFTRYRLTNRIRVNKELSSFISFLMMPAKHRYYREFPSVGIAYANNQIEAEILINDYLKNGYTYIKDSAIDSFTSVSTNMLNVEEATCKEFDKVLMLIDDSVYYNDMGMLVSKEIDSSRDSCVRNLFHGLNRGKNNIALIVINNEQVVSTVLDFMQQ